MCTDTFFVDEDCTFAQRGVVLVYIAVPPVIVRTVAQTFRNLWWFHRCSPWTSCGYASYCADSGSDVQKTVETFHSCSSWSMFLVNFGARTVEQTAASVLQGRVCNAQWCMFLRPCTRDTFSSHSLSLPVRLTLRIRVVRHDLRLLTELDQHLYRNFLRELFWRTEHARSLTVEHLDDIYNFTAWSYG